MQNKIITKLTTDQSLTLHGPGLVKVNAAKSVTISKVTGSKVAALQMGSSTGSLHLGALASSVTPFLGFAILSIGTFALVKMWMNKVDRGECS
jgi:hypothetical protein